MTQIATLKVVKYAHEVQVNVLDKMAQLIFHPLLFLVKYFPLIYDYSASQMTGLSCSK
jgi:hypothetical protein